MKVNRPSTYGWQVLVAAVVACCAYAVAGAAPASTSEGREAASASAPELELLEYLGGLATQGSQWIGPDDMAIEETSNLHPAIAVARGTSVDEKTARPSSEVQHNDE